MTTKRERHWNLFARELEAILTAHRQSLSALDPALGIAESKARRLQQSLSTPNSWPVLDPEEMEKLEQELPLSREEWMRLRAALLAVWIERMLSYRIDQQRALQAAEHLLPLVNEALQEQSRSDGKLRAIRGPDSEAREDTGADQIWERIWEMLDMAMLALQLSYSVPDRERMKKLREARADFQAALDQLNTLDGGTKSLPIWADASKEAQRGLGLTIEILEDLVGPGDVQAH